MEEWGDLVWAGKPLAETDLDTCICGHIRGVHQEWPSGGTCAGDEVTVEQDCPCDMFEKEGT